jgi:hypothetical protein
LGAHRWRKLRDVREGYVMEMFRTANRAVAWQYVHELATAGYVAVLSYRPRDAMPYAAMVYGRI